MITIFLEIEKKLRVVAANEFYCTCTALHALPE